MEETKNGTIRIISKAFSLGALCTRVYMFVDGQWFIINPEDHIKSLSSSDLEDINNEMVTDKNNKKYNKDVEGRIQFEVNDHVKGIQEKLKVGRIK